MEEIQNTVEEKVKNYRENFEKKDTLAVVGWLLSVTGSFFIGSYVYMRYEETINYILYTVINTIVFATNYYLHLLTSNNFNRGVTLAITGVVILYLWNKVSEED